MKARSHLVGGLTSGFLVTNIAFANDYFMLDAIPITVITSASLIGSIFPDIDVDGSTISRSNPILRFIIKIFMYILKGITWVLLHLMFWIKPKKRKELLDQFGHRGIIHSLFMAIVVTALLLLAFSWFEYKYYLILGFFVGYISHLLMDTLTVSGVKWLLPFDTHSFHYPFIRLTTGKTSHEIIACILCIVVTFIGMIGVYIYLN